MIIKVHNNLTDQAPFTFLSVAKAAAVGTINVKNINGFSANWAAQIGQTGEERSEIKIASSASGTNIVLSANTTYEHPADTPVYAIKFDQIVFEKSTSGTAGTASPVTDGTVSITPDNIYTQFDDTSGVSTDAYRTYFRNSVTTDISTESDWLTVSGFSFYSLAKLRSRVKGKLFSFGYIKDDAQIDDWINEWLEVMNNAVVKIDQSFLLGTANISFGTSGLGTVTETDFMSQKRVWITYDSVTRYRATKLDQSFEHPNATYNSVHPYYSWRGDTVFKVLPAESGGTAEISYYKRNPILVNDTDEIPPSMRSYTNSFVNYALSEAYFNDDKDDRGKTYFNRAMRDKDSMIMDITPRDFVDIEMIEITETVQAENDDF